MYAQHHRFQIWNSIQHPYSHDPSEFYYSNPALPPGEVTNMGSALDWIMAVLYPKSQPAVATPAALPPAGNTLNDYRIVNDDGDGKSAGYRWEQREGDVSPSWYKIYDMDWGEESVLSGFIDKTLDVYVKRAGYDDLDASGSPYTGDLAGQRIYGGASANTHLILYANSGDGVGAGTGFVQFGDNARPLVDSTFSLGTTGYRWTDVFTDSLTSGDLVVTSGSITDSSGAISFGDENLSTTGSIVSGTLTMAAGSITDSSGAISFGDENLTTTGNITGAVGGFTTVNTTNLTSTNITMTGQNGVVKAVAGVFGASLLVNADVSATAGIVFTKMEALTTSRAIVTNAATGFLEVSAVTSTELGYVSGVTSSIQTQLDGKALRGLTNLTATSINQALIPDGDGTRSLGTTVLRWANLYAVNIADATNSMTTLDLLRFRDASTGASNGDALFFDNATGRWLPSAPDSEVTHAGLSGLGADDHTQYLLMAGRALGQTIYGGNAISETLTLSGSSHITSGGVIIDDDLFVASDNNRDLGNTTNSWRNLYIKGEAFGFRLQGSNGLPSASVSTTGRLIYETVSKDIYIDEGGNWRRVGVERYKDDSGGIWDGTATSHIYTVSASIDDAREAIWQFRDTSANNFEVLYPEIVTTQTAVTVTFAVPPVAGNYTLIGIR